MSVFIPCPNCKRPHWRPGERCEQCGYEPAPPSRSAESASFCPKCASDTFDGCHCDYCGYDAGVPPSVRESRAPDTGHISFERDPESGDLRFEIT